MNYIELNCHIKPKEEFSEIVIALLAEKGFEMFEESDTGVKAYIRESNFDKETMDSLQQSAEEMKFGLKIKKQIIEQQNWNEEWEKNFHPVSIKDKVYIRAAFHDPHPEYSLELIIQPKMSFGTGHHETTAGIIELMLDLDFKNKRVLDMGCGSGILAILACKMNALEIIAVDYDENCFINSKENCEINNTTAIEVIKGDASVLTGMKPFDIIIANINRNIILQDLEVYISALEQNGLILLSGFYENDLNSILEKAALFNLHLERKLVNKSWCACLLKRI